MGLHLCLQLSRPAHQNGTPLNRFGEIDTDTLPLLVRHPKRRVRWYFRKLGDVMV